MKIPVRTLAVLLIALIPSLLPANEEHIADIRALYARFENATPATTRHLKFGDDDGSISGSMTTTVYQGGLTKVHTTYVPGDHDQISQTFYFGPRGLFFVYESSSHWQFAPRIQEDGSTTTDSLFETRFYFKDGACIRQLERSLTIGTKSARNLPSLIQKVPNKPQTPADAAEDIFVRALALRGITTSEEASRFFDQH